MNTSRRTLSSFSWCLRLAVFLLLANKANAQTAFTNATYAGWNSTTQAFATIPTGTGATFTQISRGPGLGAPAPVTSGITSNGWDGTASAAAAVAANKFFTFTINADASTTIDVTGMVLALQRSSSGPGSFEMEYSVNSGPYAVFGSPFSSSSSSTFTQTLSGSVTVPASGNVVFRLVGWNASGSTGTFRINNNTAINGTTLGAVSLSTTTITGAPFCVSSTSGAPATVSYSATGSFNVANVFTAELSDASGSFATPVAIGTLPGNATTGTINATIPAGTAVGTAYRIRVVANSPNATGSDNGSDLSVIPGVGFTYAVSDISCNGMNDGSVTTNVSEGIAPITYAWSNSATTSSISGLSAGSYSLTIASANGCSGTINAITVTDPPALTVSQTFTNILCNSGSNGSVTLTTSGGTAPYAYAWSNAATSQNISGLIAGSYSVLITDSHGCTQTASATLTEPTAITASTSAINALCNGGNGSATLSVSGGTPGYTYNWSNGFTSQNLSNVAAGSYSVTIIDNNSCTQTASVTINEPSAIVASTSAVNALCNGGNGSATLTVNGGTPGYMYSWSDGSTSQNLSNVAAGNYSVTIIDNNSCTQTASITINEPSAIVASTSAINALCNGGNGSATLTVSGGTPGYTYSWSDGSTSQNLSNVAAGNYSVTITDNNNCTQTASVTINEPSAIVASTSAINALCNGGNGSATLSVSGGTPGYTYNWSDGSTSQNLSNVAAGSYSVTITDNNSCTQTASVTINEPSAIVASTSAINALCNGGNGSATLSVSGGTPGYTYSWSDGSTSQNLSNVAAGNYSVTITDNNSCTQTASVTINAPSAIVASTSAVNALCNGGNGSATLSVSGGTPGYTYNWSDGSTSQNLSNVAAGNYSVTITDNNNCTQTASVIITEPTAITSSIVSTMASCGACADGSADLSVSGGTPNYSYAWSDGSTTEDLVNTLPGTYTVVITDANGCTQNDTVTVNFSTGIEATTIQNAFAIYPNPSTGDEVHIRVNENQTVPGALSFSVSDATGREVYRSVLNGNYTVSLPLPDGVYVYRIENDNHLLQSGRLVIVR